MVEGMTLVEKVNVTTGTGWQMGLCVGNTGMGFRLSLASLVADAFLKVLLSLLDSHRSVFKMAPWVCGTPKTSPHSLRVSLLERPGIASSCLSAGWLWV